MHPLEDQESYYDRRWSGFEYANSLKLVRAAAILTELGRLRHRSPPRIIDLGCGAGWLTAMLSQFGPAEGVELSGEAVGAARLRWPHLTFNQADLASWEPSGERFDVVVSHEVIEHLEDQVSHVALISRLLVGGGHLILTTPNAGTFDAMPPEQRESWSNQPIENWLTRQELRQLLRAGGLDVLRATTIIPGYGSGGLRRLANSSRLGNLLGSSRFKAGFDTLRCHLGLGLHQLVVARHQ